MSSPRPPAGRIRPTRPARRRLAVLAAVATLASLLAVQAPTRGMAAISPAVVPAVDMGARGYWLAAADGGIFTFGDAEFYGSTGGMRLNRPVVAAAGTPSGEGYWLAASDGGIFNFGDARFHGSTGAMALNRPVVGMAPTPSGRGYWLVASDGGVFNFGDARFHGSTGAIALARPIVGMAPTPSGRGYWLVASDGGVFNFGDADFLGSGAPTGATFAGMAATRSGDGYWLVTTDGRTLPFGDADDLGSVSGLAHPVVGVAVTPSGRGAWLVASDGGIFTLGDAVFLGSTGAMRLNQPIVTAAASRGDDPVVRVPQPTPPAPVSPTSPPASSRAAFDVALIGDTGYSKVQDETLLQMRSRMAGRNLAFVIHDGDIHKQDVYCNDERLRYVRDVFDGFAHPFIYTPGDNEWYDCPDPDERLASLRRIFFPGAETLGQRRFTVERQATWVENARWTRGGVVFVTINLPGGAGSGIDTDAAVAWLNAAFDRAQATGAPGVMVVWQDNPFVGGANDRLVSALKSRTRQFGRPVVLVHGDTHTYRIDHPWDDVANFTRVETWAEGSDKWVQVRVDPANPKVFTFTNER